MRILCSTNIILYFILLCVVVHHVATRQLRKFAPTQESIEWVLTLGKKVYKVVWTKNDLKDFVNLVWSPLGSANLRNCLLLKRKISEWMIMDHHGEQQSSTFRHLGVMVTKGSHTSYACVCVFAIRVR